MLCYYWNNFVYTTSASIMGGQTWPTCLNYKSNYERLISNLVQSRMDYKSSENRLVQGHSTPTVYNGNGASNNEAINIGNARIPCRSDK